MELTETQERWQQEIDQVITETQMERQWVFRLRSQLILQDARIGLVMCLLSRCQQLCRLSAHPEGE